MPGFSDKERTNWKKKSEKNSSLIETKKESVNVWKIMIIVITRLARLLVKYNDETLRLMITSIVITGDRTLLLSRHCERLPWSDGGLPHVQWSQWSNSRGQRDLRYTPFLRRRSLGE